MLNEIILNVLSTWDKGCSNGCGTLCNVSKKDIKLHLGKKNQEDDNLKEQIFYIFF